jgi:hypothetical protein
MRERRIINSFETGSISLVEARNAVKAVKLAKKNGKAAGSTANQLAKARARYLGHFGVGPPITGPNSRKSASRRTTARKSASK